MSEVLERQNRVIIELLARSSIGADKIGDIVRKGKKDPDGYVNVYNQLDGVKTATDLAKVIGVSKQNMSEILKSWEEQGIVYDTGTDKLPKYVRLLKLPTNKSGSQDTKSKTKQKKQKEIKNNDIKLPSEAVIEQVGTEAILATPNVAEVEQNTTETTETTVSVAENGG